MSAPSFKALDKVMLPDARCTVIWRFPIIQETESKHAMNLTVNQIRFLLAVLSLASMDEDIASKNIARILGVTRPSVHGMLEQMIERGFIEKARYGSSWLTAEGLTLARALEARRDKLMLLFIRRDGFPIDEALIAATNLMSVLKEESLQALEAQLHS